MDSRPVVELRARSLTAEDGRGAPRGHAGGRELRLNVWANRHARSQLR
jgi:hypothetical protein